MMRELEKNKPLKKIAIISILIISTILLYITNIKNENSFMKKQAIGPSQFIELLELSKYSIPDNDPYKSSEIKPDDPLFKSVRNIQIGLPAADLLRPLAEEENAVSIFWLAGRISGLESLYGGEAALYRKSAELGNPYAAMKLDPRLNASYQCDPKLELTHFRCDEKWGEMALRILKARADSGDIKAEYYYLKSKIKIGDYESSEDYNNYIDIATRGAKEFYYRPLYDLIRSYYLSIPQGEEIPKNNIKAIESLIIMMLNNNYSLAASLAREPLIYERLPLDLQDRINEKYITLGFYYPFAIEFFDTIYDSKTASENSFLIYRNLYILKDVYGIDYYQRVDEEVRLLEKAPIRLAAEEEARSIIETIHFPIYIDEQNIP